MEESPLSSHVLVHDDITKVVGGRKYYFAERETEKGFYGFWVSESWKNNQQCNARFFVSK